MVIDSPMRRIKRQLAQQMWNTFLKAGLFDALHRLLLHHLTVLAYHRIIDRTPEFDIFDKVISATPAGFAEQMDFISRHFNVVSIEDVLAWLRGECELPPHPLLITFDDGYRDNYTNARPVLQERSLPAVIFVATSCIGSSIPFYWDLLAYCFHHTERRHAHLPLLGEREWTDSKSKEEVMLAWIAALKRAPDSEMREVTRKAPDILDVSVDGNAFAGLYMSWDEVREMVAAGIAVQAHTVNHPILTRISLDEARTEAVGAKETLEQHTGRPVVAFAYPNGMAADFNPALEAMLAGAGFEAAFTLLPGPASPAEARRRPLSIRRVQIVSRDTLPRFAAKLVGLPRLVRSLA